MLGKHKRPITPVDRFEIACEKANLTEFEYKVIDYIRFIGLFTQPSLTKGLNIKAKPPILTSLCAICRKIGEQMPSHFREVRAWSVKNNEHNVRWDGNLICAGLWTVDGELLSPENGNIQYHTFTVHKELFQGLN